MIIVSYACCDRLIGNYNADTPDEREAAEDAMQEMLRKAEHSWNSTNPDETLILGANTKMDIYDSVVGLGAIVTFLGLYIGLVFLIACGAVLSLKELSESTDSIERYAMLRKIGAEERDLNGSLLVQTGIFFLLPLVLACVHSVFGLRFSADILETIGTQQVGTSMRSTLLIILLIYGGYFLVTYCCSRGIIKEWR